MGADQPTEDLLRALEGSQPFSPEQIAHDLEHPPSQERIERIIVALDRAGPQAPAAEHLPHARAALSRLHREQRKQQLRDRGFFGRSAEKERLKTWLKVGQMAPPVQAAFLLGLPGIGKSALLEEMICFAGDRDQSINVRLDFDRAGLSALDVLGLTMEVARQVAERLGEAGKPLLDARLAAASLAVGEEAVAASRQSSFPRELGSALAQAVAASGKSVTFVLDTLEVLRGRGETHPILLFEWLDKLVEAGVRPVRIIAAARGDALDTCPERVGQRLTVGGLEGPAALDLLKRLDVPPDERQSLVELAAGNPLVLRLGAEIVTRYGAEPLRHKQLEKQTASAFLYRFLLSRIDNPALVRLAHPGLIVRRISAGLVREVLGPELGLPPLSELASEALFEELAGQHWLVGRDPLDPLFLVHRSDIRAVLLPLLYREEAALCASINDACVSWFAAREDAESQVDAAYHRLQLLRTRSDPPLIDASVLRRFDAALTAELPVAAQEIVLRASSGRTTSGGTASAAVSPADDERLAGDLMNLLERQDWAEGQYLVSQLMASASFDARSLIADAVRAFWWGAGRWRDALRLLAERDLLTRSDEDLGTLPWPLAIARIEMAAEFDRRRLVGMLAHVTPARMEDEFRSSSRPLVRDGALPFVLAAHDERLMEVLTTRSEPSAVAAAFECWCGRDGRAFRHAASASRELLMSRGAPADYADEEFAAQLLAVHSPYVRFAANLMTQEGYGWLLGAAAEADGRLSAAGGLFGQPFGALGTLSSNPLAGLTGLGLLAEWLGVVAFARRNVNLRPMARAAERWRRAVAGFWHYGREPGSWRGSAKLDSTTQRRVRALLDGTERREAAADQIALWLPAGMPVDEVGQRFATTLKSAATASDPLQRAAALQQANVPSAFVPALAVLTGADHSLPGDRR
jgi:hypothetical protein